MTEQEKEYRTERMVRAMVECNKLTMGCVTTGQVARRLKMSVKDLYKRLQELGILFKDSGMWMLAPQFTGLNLLRYRYMLYYTLEGEQKTRVYPVWTPDGVEFIMHNA
jgi:phage antirepressor YoqD-like protein